MPVLTKGVSGVMVMKNGQAWGTKYSDGYSTDYGWIDPVDAPIHDPRYCSKPTDVTHKDSIYRKELSTGKLVLVTKTTTIERATSDLSPSLSSPPDDRPAAGRPLALDVHSRWPLWDDMLTPEDRATLELEREDRFDLLTELKLQQEGL